MNKSNITGLLIYKHKIIKLSVTPIHDLLHALRKGVREKKTKSKNAIGLTTEIEFNNEVSFAVEDPSIIIKLQPYNKPANTVSVSL